MGDGPALVRDFIIHPSLAGGTPLNCGVWPYQPLSKLLVRLTIQRNGLIVFMDT